MTETLRVTVVFFRIGYKVYLVKYISYCNQYITGNLKYFILIDMIKCSVAFVQKDMQYALYVTSLCFVCVRDYVKYVNMCQLHFFCLYYDNMSVDSTCICASEQLSQRTDLLTLVQNDIAGIFVRLNG